MNKQDRIDELEEMMKEFVINEGMIPEDESPSWEEIIEAQIEAEKKWNETAEGKEFLSLLGK